MAHGVGKASREDMIKVLQGGVMPRADIWA